MEPNALFIAASRQKLRIAASKGQLTVEDLWDLSLKSLDEIALRLDSQLAPSRKSFLENPSDAKADAKVEADRLALEIIKWIIEVRQAENRASLEARQKEAQRKLLLELRDQKKMEEFRNLPLEEIEKRLAAIEG